MPKDIWFYISAAHFLVLIGVTVWLLILLKRKKRLDPLSVIVPASAPALAILEERVLLPTARGEGLRMSVTIDYNDFISAAELSAILTILDVEVWREFEKWYESYNDERPITEAEMPLHLVGITQIRSGSLILTAILSTATITYCFNRFGKGFKKANVGEEIERFGLNVGNLSRNIISRVNVRLEKFLIEGESAQSNIKAISVKVQDDRDPKATTRLY